MSYRPSFYNSSDFIIKNVRADCLHFLHHKVQIVDGGKLHNHKLFGFKEVVQVGAAKALAGTALALCADGAKVGFVFALGEVYLA